MALFNPDFLTDTGVTPNTYTHTTLTVDRKGRITAASNGAIPSAPPCYSTITGTSGSASALVAGSTLSFLSTNGMTLVAADASPDTLTVNTPQDLQTTASPTFNVVGHGAGAVGTPSITFSDNLDTGFYESITGASGNIALAVQGSQALRIDSVDNWGWHGTAPTAAAYHAATVSTTARSQFLAVDMTRSGLGGATLTILRFIVRPQNDVGTNTGSFQTVVERNNPNRPFVGVLSDCGLGSATTMASGSSQFYGFNFVPTAATGGNVTGGTLAFTGFRFGAIPANYAGGGATTYFRGSYFGDNLGSAYGNSEAAPDLLIYSDGANGIVEHTGDMVFNESGASVDHRIEGDTDANLFFLDASADTVQIGATTASDSAKFYVSGKISTSAEMEINGDLNHDGTNVGFYAKAPAVQQTSGADLTNNVTSGGSSDVIANYTDLIIYANDAAAIRNDIYQLARKLKQVNDGLRAIGLLT